MHKSACRDCSPQGTIIGPLVQLDSRKPAICLLEAITLFKVRAFHLQQSEICSQLWLEFFDSKYSVWEENNEGSHNFSRMINSSNTKMFVWEHNG